MKLAASSTSSITTLAQLQDFPDIVKESATQTSDDVSESEDDLDESYGSGEDLRTDLTDEQLHDLKQAVHDALTLLTLPLTPPPRSAPIVQTTRNNLMAPTQFQSRAFGTSYRQSAQRQSQFGAFGRESQRIGSNSFSWRRDVARNPNPREVFGRPKPIETNESAVTSWRKTQPGTEWKWNDNTNRYTLTKV